MNITYMIGNGFDINIGLNTRYTNFYPYFIKYANKDNMIKMWIDGNEIDWADLEEKLGTELSKVDEKNLDKFYDDKYELDILLLEYLEEEQKKIEINNYEEKIAEEFVNSLITFNKRLSEEGKRSITEILNQFSAEEYAYSFVTFNYTNILSKIFYITRKIKNPITTHVAISSNRNINNRLGEVLHIHGTIDEEMILGVNDETQINNVQLKTDENFKNTIIKSKMNENIGQHKTEKAKKIINESHIICIFGMSLGNTDKMWWEIVVDWLFANKYNALILYHKGSEEELKRKIPARTINLDNKWKNHILKSGKVKYSSEELEKMKNRIYVSYNTDIFNFKQIFDEEIKQDV